MHIIEIEYIIQRELPTLSPSFFTTINFQEIKPHTDGDRRENEKKKTVTKLK